MFAPAVVIHGLDHARQTLSIGRPVCLLSAPGAGRYAGVAWWRAMVAAALAERDGIRPGGILGVGDVLDCGDAPGAAMAALRHGQRAIILDPRCPAWAAVTACAGTLGAVVLDQRPDCLDLADPAAARLLPAWLAPRTGSSPAAGDIKQGLR